MTILYIKEKTNIYKRDKISLQTYKNFLFYRQSPLVPNSLFTHFLKLSRSYNHKLSLQNKTRSLGLVGILQKENLDWLLYTAYFYYFCKDIYYQNQHIVNNTLTKKR
jgi:hypothetical protein